MGMWKRCFWSRLISGQASIGRITGWKMSSNYLQAIRVLLSISKSDFLPRDVTLCSIATCHSVTNTGLNRWPICLSIYTVVTGIERKAWLVIEYHIYSIWYIDVNAVEMHYPFYQNADWHISWTKKRFFWGLWFDPFHALFFHELFFQTLCIKKGCPVPIIREFVYRFQKSSIFCHFYIR